MIIKALFIGTNSLGYEKGKTYELKLISGNIIKRINGTGMCEYGSIYSFFDNWTNIVNNKEDITWVEETIHKI